MIDVVDQGISQAVTNALVGTPLAGATIRATAFHPTSGDTKAIPTSTISFEIEHKNIKADPNSYVYVQSAVTQLGAALGPDVKIDFRTPEQKARDMATDFAELQKLVPSLIPAVYNEYFEQKVKDAVKHTNNHECEWRNFAGEVNRDDKKMEVSVVFDIPRHLNPDEMVKLLEMNKSNTLKFLGEYIERKHPGLKGKTEQLDMSVDTQSWGDWKRLVVTFRSKEVAEAIKAAGSIEAIDAKKHEELKETPLMKLRNGSNSTPDNPPELQKALLRSIFQSSPDFTAKMAKAPDMFAAISKPLKKLAAAEGTSQEIKDKIVKFLNDDMFKTRDEIKALEEKGIFHPIKPSINNATVPDGQKNPGIIKVDMTVPTSHFPDIVQRISSTVDPAAQAPTNLKVADHGGKVVVGGKEYTPGVIQTFLENVGIASPPASAVERVNQTGSGAQQQVR